MLAEAFENYFWESWLILTQATELLYQYITRTFELQIF